MITEDGLKETEKVPVTVYVTPNETVTIERKRGQKPSYLMVGNGTMNKHKIFAIDLLRELANASKAGQFLLLAIKDGITHANNYNPVVNIRKNELTKTQQQYLVVGYKELVEKDLVRRVKNGWYMINPNALVPLDYEEAMEIWENAKK